MLKNALTLFVSCYFFVFLTAALFWYVEDVFTYKLFSHMEHKTLEDRVSALERAVFGDQHDVHEAKPAHTAKQQFELHEPDSMTLFFQWLAKDWLMKLGAFLLILGVGWFVRYAFIQNWIGPGMRIFLGILVGFILFALGNYIILTRRIPGQVLVATGIIMQFVTMFAARNVYDFFTPVGALIGLGVIVVCMATSAAVHHSRPLAILAYIGGLLAPMLIDAPRGDTVRLLQYIFLLDLGVLALVALRGWRSLLIFSLIGTFFYTFMFSDIPVSTVWIFMGFFYAFFVFSQLYVSLKDPRVEFSDIAITSLNTGIFLYWVGEYVPASWQGFVMVAAGLLSLLIAVIFSFQSETHRSTMILYAGAAAFSFVSATMFQLEGTTLVIALSFESIFLAILSAFVVKSVKVTEAVSPLYLLPFVLALSESSFSRSVWMRGDLLGDHFFSVLSLTLAAAMAALILKRVATAMHHLMIMHAVVASFFTLSLVWLTLHNILEPESTARGVALILFALAGVGLFFYGIRHEAKTYGLFGKFLLGGVVLRLLFVEVWQMPLAGRVIVFLLIGILLMATAFFERRSNV